MPEHNTKEDGTEPMMNSQAAYIGHHSRARARSILAPGFTKDKDGYLISNDKGEELKGPAFVNTPQECIFVLVSTLVKAFGLLIAMVFNAILAIPFFVLATVPVLVMEASRNISAQFNAFDWPILWKGKPAPDQQRSRIDPTLIMDKDISPLILAADSDPNFSHVRNGGGDHHSKDAADILMSSSALPSANTATDVKSGEGTSPKSKKKSKRARRRLRKRNGGKHELGSVTRIPTPAASTSDTEYEDALEA